MQPDREAPVRIDTATTAERVSFVAQSGSRTPAARTGLRPLAMRSVACDEWDRLIAGFGSVCQEQTYAFASVRWPKLSYEPWLFVRDGEAVGGALIMLARLPLGLGSFALCKWGPMLRDRNAVDSGPLHQAMIEALIRQYAVERRMVLSVLPRRYAGSDRDEFDFLQRRGFSAGANVPFPDRYIVDLEVPEDGHSKRLHSKWRYHLNKAEKAGLSFEEADGAQLPEFAALYEAMTERKKFPDYSAYETLPSLFAAPAEAIRPRIFFVRHQGRIIAGAVIFTAGDMAVYLYGATSDEALPLRAGYFLHWRIIRWLKENSQASCYDLGGCDGFLGLHQFKKGMVGEAGWIEPLDPPMHYAAGRLRLAVGTGVFALRDFLLGARHRMLMRWSDRSAPNLTPPARER